MTASRTGPRRALTLLLLGMMTLFGCTACDTIMGMLGPRPGDEEPQQVEAPVNVSAAPDATTGVIEVTWDPVVDADSYRVRYKTDSHATWTSETTSATSFTLSVTSDAHYYFTVQAEADGELSDESTQVSAIVTSSGEQSPEYTTITVGETVYETNGPADPAGTYYYEFTATTDGEYAVSSRYDVGGFRHGSAIALYDAAGTELAAPPAGGLATEFTHTLTAGAIYRLHVDHDAGLGTYETVVEPPVGAGPVDASVVYVSPTGSDANAGTSPSSPKLTIRSAVELAETEGVADILVRLQEGTYQAGTHFAPDTYTRVYLGYDNTSITLSGGWSGDFRSQTGYSTLDGMNNGEPVLEITRSNVAVEKMRFINGNRGVVVEGRDTSPISGISLWDVEVRDNTSSAYGAGIYIHYADTVTIDAVVTNNDNSPGEDFGGGICVFYGSNVDITGTISGNTSSDYGAGIAIAWGENVTLHDALIENNSNVSTSNTWGRGGGVYVVGTNHTVTGNTVRGNSAAYGGGGVYLGSGMVSGVEISGNTITQNELTLAGEGTGLMAYTDGGNIISSNTITNNTGSHAETNAVVAFDLGIAPANLQFTGNTIGGVKDGTSYAFMELRHVSGHTITDNELMQETLDFLYQDMNSFWPPPVIAVSELAKLNTAVHEDHDAAVASGNTLTGLPTGSADIIIY